MLELTPELSSQAYKLLREKVDQNKDNKITLKELTAAVDGASGASKDGKIDEDELTRRGFSTEDAKAILLEADRLKLKSTLDPQQVIFELPLEVQDPDTGSTEKNQFNKADFSSLKDIDLSSLNEPSKNSDAHDLKAQLSGDVNGITFPSTETKPETVEERQNWIANRLLESMETQFKEPPLTDAQKVQAKAIFKAYMSLDRVKDKDTSNFDITRSVAQLIKSNRLTPAVLTAVLDLADPAKTKLHPDLESQRSTLINCALGELASLDEIKQQHKNTCAATTCQIMLATREPEKYVRLVAALASPSGKVPNDFFPGGAKLEREPDTLKDDDSGRTLTSRLIQPAFMEYANDSPDFVSWIRGNGYDNAKDMHTGGITPEAWSKGLMTAEMSYLLDGLFGQKSFQTLAVEQPNLMSHDPNVLQAIGAALAPGLVAGKVTSLDSAMSQMSRLLDKGYTIPVGIRWSVSGELNFHALTLTRLDPKENKAYFINPHGEAKFMDLSEFRSRLAGVTLPVPDKLKPLPGTGDALSRLPNHLSKPDSYTQLDWKAFRSVEEHLDMDKDLVRFLSADQRDLLKGRFDKLELEKSLLQEVIDMIGKGKFSHTMLDKLQNAPNADQARKMIWLYGAISNSVLSQEQAQKVVSAYPERYLGDQFKDLYAQISQLTPAELGAPGINNDSAIWGQIETLLDVSKKNMTAVVSGMANPPEKLTPDQILARMKTLRSQGGQEAFSQIEHLASLADAKTKAAMVQELMKGWTKEQAERAIGIIIGNATPTEQNTILTTLDLKQLGNEMENADRAAELLSVISKAGFDPGVMEKHLGTFFDGVSSQTWGFNLFNTDDDTALSFVRKLDEKALQGLPDSIKMRFFLALDKGSTSDAEYAAMTRVAINSSPAGKAKILDYVIKDNPNQKQEDLIHAVIMATATQKGAKGEPPPLVQMMDRLDARELANALENDKQAAAVAVRLVSAYHQNGQKPVAGKASDMLRTLAWNHRDEAINAFIKDGQTQANGRALYQALSPQTLKDMAVYLMKGDTNEAEEDCIMNLLGNTSFDQYGAIMSGKDPGFLKQLGDELDSHDIKKLDEWTAAYGKYIKGVK